MRLHKAWIVWLGLLLCGAEALAQTPPSWRKYTRAELLIETDAVAPGQTGAIGLRLTLADQWHTYWINPGDSGVPVRISMTVDPNIHVERVTVPVPRRFETGPLVTFGFAREVLFPIEFAVASGAREGRDLSVKLEAEWLVCREICIPAIETLEILIPVRAASAVKPSDHFAAFQRARGRAPVPRPTLARFEDVGGYKQLRIKSWGPERDFVDFFPFKGSGVTHEAPHVTIGGGILNMRFNRARVPGAAPERVGVLVTRLKGSGQTEAWAIGESGWAFAVSRHAADSADLWWMLISAFIGGLILNLMPCVFPILSIKLLSLLKLGGARSREIRWLNAAYVAGVLLSFLGIAAILSILRAAGHQIGWGFQLQSPIFLALLAWLFFGLALNLFGFFEIEWLAAGFGHKLTRFSGAWGSFFTGALAVVVASPCTAPFMGVALGFGLAQPAPILMATFLSLGLGLAFPYVIFTVFPGWIQALPRPGRWMLRLKQIMAFPLLMTDIWLIWVLGQIRGPNAMVVALAGCLGVAAATWLRRSSRWLALMMLLVTVTLGVVLIERSTEAPARADHDRVWKTFSPELLAQLKGKNVLVNLTADWCLTCQVNERLIFADAGVMKLLRDRNVNLVRGDWTRRNPEITRFLTGFGRVGVPFYVLFSDRHPEGLPLAEVLTKNSFVETITAEFSDPRPSP